MLVIRFKGWLFDDYSYYWFNASYQLLLKLNKLLMKMYKMLVIDDIRFFILVCD